MNIEQRAKFVPGLSLICLYICNQWAKNTVSEPGGISPRKYFI